LKRKSVNHRVTENTEIRVRKAEERAESLKLPK